jgi:FkbM family methyltransferase
MTIISYAQNFEDIMLWRALRHVSNGFYIDVGAQHPRIDSVSRLFYEKGWRGMHIEAQLQYALLLQQDRPDEIVLPVAISDRSGVMVFYEVPIGGGGLSTGDQTIAEVHRLQNHLEVHEIVTPTLTLDDVFLQIGARDIHWLKIDVEGMEGQVIDGWTMETVKPWILVIESTFPMTETPTHEGWERKVLSRGYCHAYWDGLNRFYVATDHPDLLEHLRTPPNVFDDFSLSGLSHAPFCSHLQGEHLKVVRDIREVDDQAKLVLEETNRSLAAHSQEVEAANRRLELERIATERERDLLQRLSDQETFSAAQQVETATRRLELERIATERERDLLQRLSDQETLSATQRVETANRQIELEKISIERERNLLQRLSDQEKLSAAQQVETANRQVELEKIAIERERDMLQRLSDQETFSAAQQVETATRHLELERIATERERDLSQRLADEQRLSAARQIDAANRHLELERIATERERDLSQRLSDQETLSAAQQVETANRQTELEKTAIERERDLLQRLADQERESMWQKQASRRKAHITKQKFRRRKRALFKQIQESEIDIIQLRSNEASLRTEFTQLRSDAVSLQAELIDLRSNEASAQAELVQLRSIATNLQRELNSVQARRPWRVIIRALRAASGWLRPNTLSGSVSAARNGSRDQQINAEHKLSESQLK